MNGINTIRCGKCEKEYDVFQYPNGCLCEMNTPDPLITRKVKIKIKETIQGKPVNYGD
jgi:hypothetical protein